VVPGRSSTSRLSRFRRLRLGFEPGALEHLRVARATRKLRPGSRLRPGCLDRRLRATCSRSSLSATPTSACANRFLISFAHAPPCADCKPETRALKTAGETGIERISIGVDNAPTALDRVVVLIGYRGTTCCVNGTRKL
jgi:hypothetical protein